MTDPRIKKFAELLVNYSTRVKPGDWVHVEGDILAAPLVREVVGSALRAGADVTYELLDDETTEIKLMNASVDQLSKENPLALHSIKEADVLIFINAPANTRSLKGIDPAKMQALVRGRNEWHQVYMKRSATGELRWTLTNYPTHALAQDADMSLSDYENFIYAATFIDRDDPVAEWEKIRIDQEKLVTWLNGKNEVIIRGPNVDIKMSVAGRKFINSYGDLNMPSGEVYTSPVEDSVNGWVKFTYPAIFRGREVDGVYLEFKDGKVVKASAEKDEEYLVNMLDTDAGARYLGELGIGTNYGIQQFTRDILFDEKIGGTFHLAIGSGFEEAGGKNFSAIHWDLICDARTDTEMTIDGVTFYKNGKFLIQ
jgi:aminopeptidase